MRRRNQPIMYADANSKVGQVRVFACPHCRDGEVTKRLETENKNLKRMLREVIWMARRYANGRSTFAPTTINEIIDEAIKLGIEVKPDVAINLMYAEDGTLGKWNSEKQGFEK